MPNELILLTLTRYLDQFLFNPLSSWPARYFLERSYSIWAVNELIQRIIDNPFTAPDITLMEFLITLEMCIAVADGTNTELIFLTARETLYDVQSYLKFQS